MAYKPNISIRSGWRCINDGPHDWRTDDKYRRNGKRCNRCECTEAAPGIWLITAMHPEYGCIQKHCESYPEALAIVNRPDPIGSLFEGLTMKLGYALYSI